MAIPPIKPQINLDPTARFAILSWNRLEGRPRSVDFDRSLRAEIRDPLWLLCRQWQFGEFKGEDAGSAVKTKIQLRAAHLNRFAVPTRAEPNPEETHLEQENVSYLATGYDDLLPLETRVEREAVPMDIMTRARLGRMWLRHIRQNDDIRARYVGRFGFLDPQPGLETAYLESNRQAWQMFEALKGRAVDGARLLDAMRSSPDEHAAWLKNAIQNGNLRKKILEAASTFLEMYSRLYSQPEDKANPSWAGSYLEYQFACAAPANPEGTQQTVLVAELYHQGQLDWYSFQLDPGAQLKDKPDAKIPAPRFELEEPRSFIPTPVEFPGMPNVRWWEFEDRKTNFGDLQPDTTDLASLFLAEFGLLYSNDWSIIPYRMPVGVLAEALGVVVTDVFGIRTLVQSAVNTMDDEDGNWDMFHLKDKQGNGIDRRLFLPPVLGKMQESAPLEKVILARDEIANMVWGIEQIVPSPVGGGIDGHEAAAALESYFRGETQPDDGIIDTGATIRYRIGTQVFENWIPFIAVKVPGSNRQIRLQRAAMPRIVKGTMEGVVEPRGAILREGLDRGQPYFIHEEEVPRVGTTATRTLQRARWLNGMLYNWVGRRVYTGRGQGSSGLEFDSIVPLPEAG
jgi:hypothetical protein